MAGPPPKTATAAQHLAKEAMNSEHLTKYHAYVDVLHTSNGRRWYGYRSTVYAADRDQAATEAINRAVRLAKEHNALYGLDVDYTGADVTQFGARPEQHSCYKVVKIRKAPIRKK